MADIIMINENTWRIEDGMVRFFVLEGKDKALLIDSGMNTPDAAALAKTVTKKPLEMLNTHADRDHISGNTAFEKCYMSPAEEENFREAGGKGSIIPIGEGDIIDLGNRKLEIIDIPGHTPGSVAILDIDHRTLIAGDSVQDGNIFMFGKFRDLDSYIKSMEKLIGLKDRFDEVYPSHGTFPVQPGLIDKLIEGAHRIANGQSQGKPVDIFGNQVMLHKFDYAGFLC